jgi:GDP-L-fucose synthase
MLHKNAKIYIAGHRGLVGSAIWKNLQEKGYTNLVGRTHKELDLLDGVAVRRFFDEEQPEYVFLAAAFVGGIMANSIYRAGRCVLPKAHSRAEIVWQIGTE